jgi:Tol biopolymer transport system component
LVADPIGGQYAAWSPDRSAAAFTRSDSSGSQLVIVDAASGHEFNYPVPGTEVDLGPWSPGGGKLAFTSRGPSGADCFVIDRASGVITQLTNWVGSENPSAWADDDSLVVAQWDSDNDVTASWLLIRVTDAKASSLPWLDGAGSPLGWLP